jgi:Two component regulator propeller.
MKFKIIIFFVSLLLCETTSLFSFNDTPHNNNYLYRYYNNLEENINYTYSITQDSDGLIWMSAQEGIFRFDGNRLRKIDELFGNEYKDKIIRCSLNADIYGNVWFYKNNLLSSINVKTGKISTHLDSLLNTTPKKFIKSVIIKDSNMFLGTNSGIYSYNILSHKYSSILKTNNIALLSEIYKNNIWIIKRDNTTIKYDIITGNFEYYYPNIESLGTSTCIKQINDSTLLVGKHDNGGLWLYDLKSNNTKNLISGTTITCIESFFDGNYSMATKNGIYIFNPSNNNISLINKNHISFMSIPENFISTLKKDKEGGIWIGSYYQGFCYLPEQPIELKFYIPGTTNKDFKGNIVMQLREDSQNNMWVITQDNGVNKFNKKQIHLQIFQKII